MKARLLVATTTWWPSVGVLASALEQAGFEVVVLCPRGHVATHARHFRTMELDRHRPAASLAGAIRATDPTLVVCGDDRAVDHLRALHGGPDAAMRAVVVRSLGAASSHPLLTARVALLEAAAEAGFAVPATRAIRSEADLADWLDRYPPPWVFKADGAWGGEGVRVVGTRAAARRACTDLQRGSSAGLALKRWFLNGDPMPWQERRAREPRALSAQAYVDGAAATCALFAWNGRVLGVTIVKAVTTCGTHGPATLMRVVERPDVLAAARRLVRRLGLSGFVGLDFLIDREGVARLIEMNPRITGASRMRGPGALDPVTAAALTLRCRTVRSLPRPRTLFGSFPLAWLEDPDAPALMLCRDDLPWREPEMLRDALRPLWPERGPMAFLPARLRRWRRRLGGEATRPDLRLKPFAWWQAQASLAVPARPSSDGAEARLSGVFN